MMTITLTLLFALSLIFLAIEDFSHREISLYILLLCIVLCIVLRFSGNDPITILFYEIGINMLLISLHLLGIWIYFRIKNGRGFIDKQIGKGDLVFLLIPIILFPPALLMFFIISSSIVGVLYRIIFRKNKSIPLAGIQAIFLTLWYIPERLSLWPPFEHYYLSY